MNWPESLGPMPEAVERYMELGFGHDGCADAAIEALTKKLFFVGIAWEKSKAHAEKAEARAKALECCGNCASFRSDEEGICVQPDTRPPYVNAWHTCHFTPSRWEGRTG